MTPEVLLRACPMPSDRAILWAPFLTAACLEFYISSAADQAMFLAQIGHESGSLAHLREIWGPTAAQLRYEGRVDLGNTRKGDGFKYRGGGPIQLTGADNYRKAGKALGFNLEENPDLIVLPHVGARVSGWFWEKKGLSALSNDIEAATRRINGGLNGLNDRKRRWDLARKAYGLAA
jgi:putative chitinase